MIIFSIGSTPTTLIIPAGTWPINSDLVFPENISLEVQDGARLVVAAGKTIYLNGSLQAGDYRIFFGNGKVVFGPLVTTARTAWFGDTAAGMQAALAAAYGGSVVMFSPGSVSLTGLTVTGKSLKLQGRGTTLIQNANAPIMTLSGSWGSNYKVSAIAGYDADLDSSGTTTKVSKLTVANNAGLARGDVVKIFSDDLASWDRTTYERSGEFGVVWGTSGNDKVYLTGLIRCTTFATNIKVAKLLDYTYSLDGFTFTSDPAGDRARWTSQLVQIDSAKNVSVINCHALKGYGEFLYLQSLYGYEVRGCTAMNLKNNPNTNNYGYGISNRSSYFGKVTDCRFIDCRHGFTTDPGSCELGDTNPGHYGDSYGGIVADSTADGCSASGFDTHSGSVGFRFANLVSTGNYSGPNGAGAGFSIRGFNHSLDNCKSKGGRYGFFIWADVANQSGNISLGNCEATDASVNALYIRDTNSGGKLNGVAINGGYYEGYGLITAYLQNTGVYMDGATRFRNICTTAGNGMIFDLHSASLRLDNAKVDVQASSTTTMRLLTLNAADDKVLGNNLYIYDHTTPKLTYINYFGNAAATSHLFNVVHNYGITRWYGGSTPSPGTNYWLTYRSENNAAETCYRAQTVSADNWTPSLLGSADDIVSLKLYGNTGGPYNSTTFPDGFEHGQVVMIDNVGTATKVLKNGLTTSFGGDITLSYGQRVAITWNGSDWIKYSAAPF